MAKYAQGTTVSAQTLKNEIQRLIAEREALVRLCYRKVETVIDQDAYYLIVLETVDRQARAFETETEVRNAIFRLAGINP